MSNGRFVYGDNELKVTEEIIEELKRDFPSFVCVVIARRNRNIHTGDRRYNVITINRSNVASMYGLSAENTAVIIESEREVTKEIEHQIEMMLIYGGDKSRLYVINPMSKEYYELR